MRLSADVTEDQALVDDSNEREVGFEDSVFVSRRPTASATPAAPTTVVWVCGVCTFVNDSCDDLCEMCSTMKAIEID
jgi:hypothetical protein